MDLAPLNTAHAHACNAAALTASQGSNLNGAREEHEAAASDFAKARGSVGDSEALRILELLEHHHRQLAEIIKVQNAPKEAKDGDKEGKDGENATSDSGKTPAASEPHVPQRIPRTTSPVRTRRLHRETSSNITDNLARQRRGLPSAAELSNVQAGGRILSHIERPGYGSRQRSPESARNLPPVAERTPLAAAAEVTPPKQSEDNFSKFYTTFEGLFSKLSGPLAFAGLPLTPEQAAKDAQAHTEASKKSEKEKSKASTRASSSDEPDLTKIYSSAALKAIREDVGPSFGPQESFYLVPPTGGTVSYAGMVSGIPRADGMGRELPEAILEEGDEEFVDARESIGPPSPRSLRNSATQRRAQHSPAASREGRRPKSSSGPGPALRPGEVVGPSGKSNEELELEIGVMRQLLDTQAKRLQMWEMSSQSQSMALQQSMRAVRQRPDLPTFSREPSSPTVAQKETAAADAERIRQLEDMLKAAKEERVEFEKKERRMEDENKRLVTTVGRYRDKWEQLKAGARRREDDKRRKAGESSAVKDVED